MALTILFWFKISHRFLIISSYDLMYYPTFKWQESPSALFYLTSITRMTNSASRRVNILCIKFKISTQRSIQRCYSISHLWVSPYYAHVEIMCIIAHVEITCIIARVEITCIIARVEITCIIAHVEITCIIARVDITCIIAPFD
jgi:hypothetical protein